MTGEINNVVIIGSGPAGLTAAVYAARAMLKPIVFAGLQPGGQLTTTTEVENFPGFAGGIMGPKLMEEMTQQAQRFGAEIRYESVDKVDFSGKVKKLYTSDGEVQTKAVVIATGATAQTPKIPGEAQLMGRGISTCATCDGFFYRNKKVAVMGGGDSAMEEAQYLASLCQKVILIHRRSVFRASPIMLARAKENSKIEFKVPYVISEPISDKTGLIGIKVVNQDTRAVEEIFVDGLFYAIGHKPNSDIYLPFVDVDEMGYIKTHEYTKTKTEGVFAAGDVADPKFKQAVTAAGMGCQAALQVQNYLHEWHDK